VSITDTNLGLNMFTLIDMLLGVSLIDMTVVSTPGR
jgi:hypothetical protein